MSQSAYLYVNIVVEKGSIQSNSNLINAIVDSNKSLERLVHHDGILSIIHQNSFCTAIQETSSTGINEQTHTRFEYEYIYAYS